MYGVGADRSVRDSGMVSLDAVLRIMERVAQAPKGLGGLDTLFSGSGLSVYRLQGGKYVPVKLLDGSLFVMYSALPRLYAERDSVRAALCYSYPDAGDFFRQSLSGGLALEFRECHS